MRIIDVVDELIAANRILSTEGVVDSYGHVSARHPNRPDRFLLSRARTPACIEANDIMEFTLDGAPVEPRGRQPYLERFIHAAIYESRPDVASVVHSHSESVIPFSVVGETIRPMMHNCAPIGEAVPIWDSREGFGDTDQHGDGPRSRPADGRATDNVDARARLGRGWGLSAESHLQRGQAAEPTCKPPLRASRGLRFCHPEKSAR